MRRSLVSLLGAVLLLLGGSLPAGAQAAGSVQGRVTATTGEPVAGATLRAGGVAAVTDAAGRYLLANVPAGDVLLRAEAVGYRAQERRLEVAGGGRLVVDLSLVPQAVELEAVNVVSVTRSSLPVAAVPGAITVLGAREVEAQVRTAQSLGEVLGKAVPGLSVGTQSMSNFGQSLRGRNVAVLIDGVPQSTLRNVSRDFANIDPAMIERVEVLRGATSLYGDGATGGVINIITRAPRSGAMRSTSSIGAGGSLSRPGEGIGARLTQSVTGGRGPLTYVFSGSVSDNSGFYDAEGDLIPADPHGQGGLADTRAYDVLGKVGYLFGEQRLQLSVNHLQSMQQTEYTADPSVNQLPAGTKARALAGLREAEDQGTRNTVVNLDWAHQDLLGSAISGQIYFRDYLTRFRGFDRRRFDKNGKLLSGQVSQSFVDSHKWGGRLQAESLPLGEAGPSLVWGADYTYENTSQPVNILDAGVYDASGGLVFEKVGERLWVPPLRPHSLGLFAQLGWEPLDGLMVRGGVRRERIRMHVDDFVTLDENRVIGGDLAYDPTLFNLGVVVGSGSPVNAFASFSQGFSLADIGRILRAAKDGFSVGNSNLPAPKVDHYEVGARAAWRAVEGSMAAFYSTSKLGTNLLLGDNGMLYVARAPERIRGLEATLDVRPAERLELGGVASWSEGEAYSTKVEQYRALNGYRIQPLKLTGYVQHETLPGWTNRLQVLHSGSRDRAFEDRLDPSKPAGYGEQPIESFTVVDFSSTLPLGPGTLSLGVENLLNAQYFDIVSQLDLPDGNAYYTAARGAALSVGYTLHY